MILQRLDRFSDIGLLLLRVGLGLMYMFAHGMNKLFGGPARWERIGGNAANVGLDFLPVFWGFMAGVAEFVGGLLLVLGLYFRPALFLIFCTMTVAAVSHIVGAVPGRPYHAIELGIVVLGLFFIGPGAYSLDHILGRYRRRRF